MISRRNIRVKVMQTLYSYYASIPEGSITPQFIGQQKKILSTHFSQTHSLLVYMLWFVAEVARYAETESYKRSAKLLPSQEDLNVNIKIAGNDIIWKMLEDKELQDMIEKVKPALKTDPSFIKKFYLNLIETPEYKKYIATDSRDIAEEKNIMLFILQELMIKSEDFLSHTQDVYVNWSDDGDMLIQLVTQYIHKPGKMKMGRILQRDKEDFALSLLQTVIEKDALLGKIISPKLNNWDPDRIALLDMIIMKMGVAEFLYFETIPPKVTINECIDLAKEYSTDQSGHFVNGILDNIHKEMVAEGKMQKTDFKRG